MATKEVFSAPYLLQEGLYEDEFSRLLNKSQGSAVKDLTQGITIDLEEKSKENGRVCPVLKLATPEDAELLVNICKEVYNGTYPYKEYEDSHYIKHAIESHDYFFIKFEYRGEVVGSFKFILDFQSKSGYSGGFMIRKKYQKKIDVVKAIMASYIIMFSHFKNAILVWYCENRTAHSTSQYMTSKCGIHTIAIFPNKDIFFDKVESDVLGIIYDRAALSKLRCQETPCLIEEAMYPFLYSKGLYPLGEVDVADPEVFLDTGRISGLENNLVISISRDKYDYRHITYCLQDSNSYFTFLYTPSLSNIEKVSYQIETLEELFVFATRLKMHLQELSIRYCEVFISAYKPEHQKIFRDFGFLPRGYVPSWKYNPSTRKFEDYIVFNCFKGELGNMELLPEGYELLDLLGVLDNSLINK